LRQNAVQVVKSSRDPFKKVVYSVLGVSSLNESHSELARNIDDFLWIKLSQVASQGSSTVDSRRLDETFNLGQLQTLLYETYGRCLQFSIAVIFAYYSVHKIIFIVCT
uniref:Nuclear pore protein n=1 Tax=Echinostoma caproni TaxID=27848 RepID=A0A183BBY1_9TREM